MKLRRLLTASHEYGFGSFNSDPRQESSSSGREVGAVTLPRAACGWGVKCVRQPQMIRRANQLLA